MEFPIFGSQYDNYMTAVPIEVIFPELFDWGKANCNCNFNFYFHHNFLSFVYFLSITCVFSIFPCIVFLTAMLMNLFSKIIHCQLSIIFWGQVNIFNSDIYQSMLFAIKQHGAYSAISPSLPIVFAFSRFTKNS